jgi:hypothetical protein
MIVRFYDAAISSAGLCDAFLARAAGPANETRAMSLVIEPEIVDAGAGAPPSRGCAVKVTLPTGANSLTQPRSPEVSPDLAR